MPEGQVVSERELGSSNPVARFGRKLGDSVRGIVTGFILIIVGFGLMWYAERQPEYSKVVAALPMSEIAQGPVSGMVKLQGVPTITAAITEAKSGAAVLYYEYKKQDFKKVNEPITETKTVSRDGKDYEQTIQKDNYVDKWVDVTSEKKWAGFDLGKYKIAGEQATLSVDLKKVYEKEMPVTAPAVAPSPTATPDQLPPTKTREIVEAIPAGVKLLVVGESIDGAIAGGKPFIISDKSNDALVASMKSSESKIYWGLKIAAWLLMTIGFIMLFGPIAVFLDIVPGLGSVLNFVLFLIFGILSAIIVALGTIVVRYWWAILIVLVVLIVLGIMRKKK